MKSYSMIRKENEVEIRHYLFLRPLRPSYGTLSAVSVCNCVIHGRLVLHHAPLPLKTLQLPLFIFNKNIFTCVSHLFPPVFVLLAEYIRLMYYWHVFYNNNSRFSDIFFPRRSLFPRYFTIQCI